MAVGACGLISVLANCNGKILQDLMQAYSECRVAEVAEMNKELCPWHVLCLPKAILFLLSKSYHGYRH